MVKPKRTFPPRATGLTRRRYMVGVSRLLAKASEFALASGARVLLVVQPKSETKDATPNMREALGFESHADIGQRFFAEESDDTRASLYSVDHAVWLNTCVSHVSQLNGDRSDLLKMSPSAIANRTLVAAMIGRGEIVIDGDKVPNVQRLIAEKNYDELARLVLENLVATKPLTKVQLATAASSMARASREAMIASRPVKLKKRRLGVPALDLVPSADPDQSEWASLGPVASSHVPVAVPAPTTTAYNGIIFGSIDSDCADLFGDDDVENNDDSDESDGDHSAKSSEHDDDDDEEEDYNVDSDDEIMPLKRGKSTGRTVERPIVKTLLPRPAPITQKPADAPKTVVASKPVAASKPAAASKPDSALTPEIQRVMAASVFAPARVERKRGRPRKEVIAA